MMLRVVCLCSYVRVDDSLIACFKCRKLTHSCVRISFSVLAYYIVLDNTQQPYTTQGVAKDVELVSVKVFTDDGRGSVGSVLAGLEFVLKAKLFYPEKPMVANLSFGTPVLKSQQSSQQSSLALALSVLVHAGVTVTASAGNEAGSISACDKSPAGLDDVITVAATTNINDQALDQRRPQSTYGQCRQPLSQQYSRDARNSAVNTLKPLTGSV